MVNYVKTKIFSKKVIFCFVALLVLIQFLFGNKVISQNMIDAKEAYVLFVNSKSSIVLYIMCMALAMLYPSQYMDMYIMRLGKKRWVFCEVFSLISVVILIQLLVVLTCLIWFPRLDVYTWSPVFLASSQIDAEYFDMNIGSIYGFNDWIYFSKPIEVFWVSFFLHVLLGVLIAMLCLFFNLYFRVGYGLVAGFFLIGMSDIIIFLTHFSVQEKFKNSFLTLLLLYDNAYIGNLSNGGVGGNLTVGICIIWYIILILLFFEIIINNSKKIEVN